LSRYWARNFVGWDRFSRLQPNIGHACLAQWERSGRLTGTVTQNVDRLHQKAGSVDVVDLHGTGFTVRCLSCPHTFSRESFQHVLAEMNPLLASRLPTVTATAPVRPDADVDLSDEDVDNFHVPSCPACGDGHLQPNIVFFGDSVPKQKVESVKQRVDRSDGLLVLGSSLQVRMILFADFEHEWCDLLNVLFKYPRFINAQATDMNLGQAHCLALRAPTFDL
jgi:NAD-dependent deacetylase sirtuin 4